MIFTERDILALDVLGDALRVANLELFTWDELDHQRSEDDFHWCMTCLVRRRIDEQLGLMIERCERAIVQRLGMPFDQFKEEIPLYVRALVVCEIGFRYPFVFRGGQVFMHEFSLIHIRSMLENEHSICQHDQKIALLAALWVSEYSALVLQKDRKNDWEFGWEGWDEPHDGGICPRCEAHGWTNVRCVFCGICHTCFASYAEIRHRTIAARQLEDHHQLKDEMQPS